MTMRSIALLITGTVDNVALWDGIAVWRPIATGPWDGSVDVTGSPVAPGWTFNAGSRTFTSPDLSSTVTVAADAVDVCQ